MNLPVAPPVLPMLAKLVSALPADPRFLFEPKWDGFRALVFRDRDALLLQSREQKPLNRYFPELVEQLLAQLPERCVLDGEIVIAGPRGLDFDALQLRVHPAASRVALLAKQTPAAMIFWDALALGEESLLARPFAERRALLAAPGSKTGNLRPPLHLTPITGDRAVAEDWFRRFEGAGLDGVMAKPADGTYQPDKRVMFKVKHARECDCVVAGFRWHKGGQGTAVGSLLLGLYDGAGELQHVGVCASFSLDRRRALLAELAPYRDGALASHPWAAAGAAGGSTSAAGGSTEASEFAAGAGGDGQRVPGAKSRWSADKDLSWEPLRPELVVEVAYDHMQGNRFRHTAQFRRWRPDKPPRDCSYAQLEVVAPEELTAIFSIGG